MGIPKLISTLEPVAQRVILGQFNEKDGQSDDPRPCIKQVVIDGPSLVYHVYHILCSHYPDTAQPWNSQPGYEEINRGVLSFIRFLQEQLGVRVHKIYFDGGLPRTKRPIRMVRIDNGRRQLETLRRRHREPFCAGTTSYGVESVLSADEALSQEASKKTTSRYFLEPSGPASPQIKNLPAPPFMVPACIEFLRNELDSINHPQAAGEPYTTEDEDSALKSLGLYVMVEQVAGEADGFCAALAAKTGASVLTSDSDLIAYDLGDSGSVILLNSLELSTTESGPGLPTSSTAPTEILSALMYHPKSLCERIGRPDLSFQLFCFYRWRNPEMSVNQIKVLWKEPIKSPELEASFQDFLRLYDNLNFSDKICNFHLGSKATDLPHHLDPRLSELYLQLKEPPNEGQDLFIYFPTLLEDSRRDSAWSYGEHIRNLAYTFLAQAKDVDRVPSDGSRILEHRREGAQIRNMHMLGPLSQDDADDHIRIIVRASRLLKDSDISSGQRSNPGRMWKTFAFNELNERRSSRDKAAVSTTWLQRYVRPGNSPYTHRSWDDIHIQASLNAILYSLRMLKQAIQLRNKACEWKEESKTTKPLADVLATLPSIPDLMTAEMPEIGDPKSAQGSSHPTTQHQPQEPTKSQQVNGIIDNQHQTLNTKEKGRSKNGQEATATKKSQRQARNRRRRAQKRGES